EVVRFDVVDTGIGIAPQDRQRIFMPFERGAAGRRRGEPGTGLGLTITALLTSLMGGELSLASEPGRGSTFSVRLYLREVSDPGPQAEAPRQVGGYVGPRRTLLVVDDQPVQRQMLAGMLAPLGFVLREAASGSECLDSLRETVPDAILLDITMDYLDGWQTARLVRDAGYTLPILIVSANMFENQPERLLAAQCQAFIGKPVIESELIATLQRHLGIEWIAAHAPALPPLPPEAPADLRRLPGEARAELLRLAQIGHVHGLRRQLDAIEAGDARHAAACARLRACLASFDLEGLQACLTEAADGQPA
ncbi:MAG: response regulator, partial [Methylibium sp.]|nr:response regulator [Methylibium sp.]